MPELNGIRILVTRPKAQAQHLCDLITARGGRAISFPALDIVSLDGAVAAEASGAPDIVIFTSPNAVRHGAQVLNRAGELNPELTVGAIGPSTLQALEDIGQRVGLSPAQGFTSEALLLEPTLQRLEDKTILIVRGEGGREHLARVLRKRGASVCFAEVYRRVKPSPGPSDLAALEAQWAQSGIDIVAANSVETLENLYHMLSAAGRRSLQSTPLVTASSRVARQATALGLEGEVVMAEGPDDLRVVDAICSWSEGREEA